MIKMGTHGRNVWALLLVIIATWETSSQQEPDYYLRVELQYGQGIIEGLFQEGFEGRKYYSFKGIPYAHPPVGGLRFKDPVGNFTWKGKRYGYLEPPRCPQIVGSEILGNEDCLYLNVFTPKLRNRKYPVMVFIHGGEFLNGAAQDYSPMPLLTQDIVLVVIQYRLGVLGFLSAEDEVLPGNYGLKDQTMALKWVQCYIKDFGGDPNKVTIFGTGSGGASVHYQILTPYAKGLFTGAIIQSGSALCPRMLRKSHKFLATELSQKLSCQPLTVTGVSEPYTSCGLFECLKDASVRDIVTSFTDFEEWRILPQLNVPRVDGDYIPHHPAVLMKEGKFNKVDLLAGFNRHEGTFVTGPLYHHPALMNKFRDDFLTTGALTMGFEEEDNPALLAGLAYRAYIGTRSTRDQEGADRLTELFTDRLFGVCIHDTLDLNGANSEKGQMYAYQLIYRGTESFCQSPYTHLDDDWVCHGDDTQYLFDGVHGFMPTSEDDQILTEIMVKLWTNFATHGNPTPDESLGFSWDPYTPESHKQLVLSPSPLMTSQYNNKIRRFWHSFSLHLNKYLYPEEVGNIIDLDEKNGDNDSCGDFDLKKEHVFKTMVINDMSSDTRMRYKSSIDYHTNIKPEIGPTDKLARGVSEGSQKFGIIIEDLIAAAGIWSIDVHPVVTKNGQYLSKSKESMVYRVARETNDYETEDLSLYNVIKAGLLNAAVVLKGLEGSEATITLNSENLSYMIATHGDFLGQTLKDRKVTQKKLQEIREDFIKSSYGDGKSHVKKVNAFDNTDGSLDKDGNKRKLYYGDLEKIVKEESSKIPELVPSNDR